MCVSVLLCLLHTYRLYVLCIKHRAYVLLHKSDNGSRRRKWWSGRRAYRRECRRRERSTSNITPADRQLVRSFDKRCHKSLMGLSLSEPKRRMMMRISHRRASNNNNNNHYYHNNYNTLCVCVCCWNVYNKKYSQTWPAAASRWSVHLDASSRYLTVFARTI